jgi:HD-like signal output (HDOD) protein
MTPRQFARLEDHAEAIVRALDLPPCPDILAAMSRELAREHPDIQCIAREASKDVPSSAMLLKTVNSAWYGLAHKARSVHQAIAYLGLERTSLLMAGLLLRNVFPSTRRHAMAGFWEASTQLALTLAFYARALGRGGHDEAHTFGLFRDAGSAVLIHRFEDYDPAAASLDAQFEPSLTELEQARFGTDHALIGATLASEWGLPAAMCDAILWHHADFVLDMEERPIADAAIEMIALGVLGDRAIGRHRGMAQNEASTQVIRAASRTLGLDEDRYADLEARAVALLGGLAGRAGPAPRIANLSLH